MIVTLVSAGVELLSMSHFLFAIDVLLEKLTERESSIGADSFLLSCVYLRAGSWLPRIFCNNFICISPRVVVDDVGGICIRVSTSRRYWSRSVLKDRPISLPSLRVCR